MANSMVNLVSRLIATGNSFSYKNENIHDYYGFCVSYLPLSLFGLHG